MSEKTEAPTPQRLREARKKGQLPRSRLLSASVVTFAALLALVGTAQRSFAELRALGVRAFSGGPWAPAAALSEALRALAGCALPVVAAAFAASALVSVATAGGLHWNPRSVLPEGSRIDPFAGLERLFSRKRALELLKSALVGLVVGWICWREVRAGAGGLVRAVRLEGVAAYQVLLPMLGSAVLKSAALLAALGGGDYLLARRSHLRELRMSRDEVRREQKDSEGDPHHKGQRKALHRQLAQGGQARGVQSATAIVVNPTHIAVALRYSPGECEAPYLVAKGREGDALAIRREGQALGIPIVRDVPLARSLVHYDVGEEVPEELYRAAAAVLKVALESSGADLHPRSQRP